MRPKSFGWRRSRFQNDFARCDAHHARVSGWRRIGNPLWREPAAARGVFTGPFSGAASGKEHRAAHAHRVAGFRRISARQHLNRTVLCGMSSTVLQHGQGGGSSLLSRRSASATSARRDSRAGRRELRAQPLQFGLDGGPTFFFHARLLCGSGYGISLCCGRCEERLESLVSRWRMGSNLWS